MSGWTFGWVMWLIMFGAIEGPALAHRASGATLSQHIWNWFAITRQSAGWRLRRFALLALLAWLCAHFLSGGKF